MQNKCNNCDRSSGFVSLDGSWGGAVWNCGSCGCSNCGCDVCSNCGWNRCGCNQGCGAVVYTQDEARRNRCDDGCDDGQHGQNARQDRDNDCGCGKQNRSGDCGCGKASYGDRSLYVECCDDNTCVRDFSGDCGKCRNGAAYGQKREGGCNRCEERCDKCEGNGAAYGQKREGRCNKCEDKNDGYRSRKNKGVGMVWAAKQELDQVFESESALRSGTLFPELHKPMNGYCPGPCNCQTDERAAAFAAWELRLYLNTHPHDKQALALFRKLCGETDEPNYATTFLKDQGCCSGWDWTDDPWPWECRPCGK